MNALPCQSDVAARLLDQMAAISKATGETP